MKKIILVACLLGVVSCIRAQQIAFQKPKDMGNGLPADVVGVC